MLRVERVPRQDRILGPAVGQQFDDELHREPRPFHDRLPAQDIGASVRSALPSPWRLSFRSATQSATRTPADCASAEWGLVLGSSSDGRGPRGELERPTHFDLLRTL